MVVDLLRILASKRLILRPFEYGDAESIYETWGQDKDVTKYVTWWEHTCLDDCRAYVAKVIQSYVEDANRMEWLVCLKETGEPIGAICVFYNESLKKWGFGNNYAKKYWHQGYASEALDAVLEYMFMEYGVDCVFGEHFADNPNSGKVMQHCGMKYISEKTVTRKNIDYISKYYEVTKFEWMLHKVSTFGTVETKRLKLRALRQDDISILTKMFADKDVNKYLMKGTKTEEAEVKKKLSDILICSIKEDYRYFVIEHKRDKEVVGVISLVVNDDGVGAHSSYCYRKEYWGRGYATEALKAVMHLAFEYSDIWYFESSHAQPNVNSGAVMRRCGMTCKGYYKNGIQQVIPCMGGDYPGVICRITRPEWEKVSGSNVD